MYHSKFQSILYIVSYFPNSFNQKNVYLVCLAVKCLENNQANTPIFMGVSKEYPPTQMQTTQGFSLHNLYQPAGFSGIGGGVI